MILQFIFIKKYRSLNNQGLNLSNKFLIDYKLEDNLLEVKENPFYIENFYGKSVSCLNGIIGENGVGKTTILNYIKEVLAFPLSTNPDNLSCIVLFYDRKTNEVLVASLGYKITKTSCKFPKDIKIILLSLDELISKRSVEDQFKYKNSIFSLIEKYSNNAILYLSNVFDARLERDYGPKVSPYVFNLSTNYLAKGASINAEETSLFKNDEIYKSIKLVLNSVEHLPAIKLPQYIRINIKNILIDDFLRVQVNYKGDSSYNDPFRDELSDVLNGLRKEKEFETDKKNRVQFWLCTYLLIQIHDYYKIEKLDYLIKALKNISVDDFQNSLFSFLLENTNYLTLSNRNKRKHLPESFSWTDFLNDYNNLMNLTIKLFIKNNKKGEDFNSFKIPLIKKNEKEINNLILLSERSMLHLNLLSFSWHDMSTGETMLLRFFSNLYMFSEYLKNQKEYRFKSFLFLFDEIETFYHPQWQKRLMKSLLDFINFHFNDFQLQIIFTSHSPLVISDVPKSHLVFLRKNGDKVIAQKSLNDHKQTFAANVHSLLSDSFFLSNGLIGDFSNEKINTVIDILVDSYLEEVVENRTYIESIINIIGEPVIKAKLLELLEDRLRSNLIVIKEDIKQLNLKIK